MGTFQGYKFRAVDKSLTSQERKAVGSLSSRSEVTANSASFVYHYGDFRGNPMNVLREYFDLHIYFTNWGTKQLMIKFPIDLVDYWALKKYEIDASDYSTCSLSLNKSSKHIIIDLEWNEEEGGGWMDMDDYDLSDFIAIREAILEGDYSALYLFWLKLSKIKFDSEFDEYDEFDEFDEFDEEEDFNKKTKTPPIPSKLPRRLNELEPFIQFFEIEKDLVGAAVLAAQKVVTKEVKINYNILLQEMSETDKDTFLMQVLDGEPRMDIKLKKYLDNLANTTKNVEQHIDLQDVWDLQSTAKTNRINAEKQEAERLHLLKVKKTEREATQIWESVFYNLDRKTGKSYDLAVEMLVDLKDLAVYQNDLTSFFNAMIKIKEKYGRSKVLLQRFINAKL